MVCRYDQGLQPHRADRILHRRRQAHDRRARTDSKALKTIHSTCFTSEIYHIQTDYCNRVNPKEESMPILYL